MAKAANTIKCKHNVEQFQLTNVFNVNEVADEITIQVSQLNF